MPEEVLFESESRQERADVAAYLRRMADNLEVGEAVTLRAGGESVTLDPPPRLTFEVTAEREGAADGLGELSVELELEWEEDGEGGDLEIE